jgi:hypothetical protein
MMTKDNVKIVQANLKRNYFTQHGIHLNANDKDKTVELIKQTINILKRKQEKSKIPYILESNSHPFYSFRGLKNQMWIRIECGLDSRSRAGFWKNDRAGVRAIRTIQLFIILFIIYNILKYL